MSTYLNLSHSSHKNQIYGPNSSEWGKRDTLCFITTPFFFLLSCTERERCLLFIFLMQLSIIINGSAVFLYNIGRKFVFSERQAYKIWPSHKDALTMSGGLEGAQTLVQVSTGSVIQCRAWSLTLPLESRLCLPAWCVTLSVTRSVSLEASGKTMEDQFTCTSVPITFRNIMSLSHTKHLQSRQLHQNSHRRGPLFSLFFHASAFFQTNDHQHLVYCQERFYVNENESN